MFDGTVRSETLFVSQDGVMPSFQRCSAFPRMMSIRGVLFVPTYPQAVGRCYPRG